MTTLDFARTKGAKDKRQRKRRQSRKRFRQNIERTSKRVIDEQLRPFRGPSRNERILGAVSTGAQLGLNLGVAAAILAPIAKANSASLKKQFSKISKTVNAKTKGFANTIKSKDRGAAFKVLEKDNLVTPISNIGKNTSKKASLKLKIKKFNKRQDLKKRRNAYSKKVGLSKSEFRGLTTLAREGNRAAQKGLRKRSKR